MSELENQYVKRGYWVNHAYGPVMGQTITSNSRVGAIIIALLAVVTSLGLTHLWHLLTFFYHQARSRGNAHPRDGLFRQQQSLLRTLPTPSALFADSVKLWFAWRGSTNNPLKRSLLHTSIALFFIPLSLVVSIFSSYVVVSVNLEVLVSSPHCGLLDWDAESREAYANVVSETAELYAPDCYQNGSLPSKCNIYSRPNVPFKMETAPCPFDSTMCITPAISSDSGVVDLNDAFGLNLPDSDRVRYRKKTTCALLNLDGRTSVIKPTPDWESALGRAPWPGEEILRVDFDNNPNTTTFRLELLRSNISNSFGQTSNVRYGELESSQSPFIPQMQLQDADVVIKGIACNAIGFSEPVNDPMFAAHEKVTEDSTTDDTVVQYRADSRIAVLGCAEQYQFCFKNSSGADFCTPLMGIPKDSLDPVPGANKVQTTVIQLLRIAAYDFDIGIPSRFKAAESLRQGMVTGLPDDQWIKEIYNWESMVWASHQTMIADYAIGPTVRAPSAASITKPPTSDAEKSLCGTQKMRKPGGFVNINVFGLVFTITVCSVIVLIDLVLLRFLIFFRKIRKAPAPQLDHWIQDGVFQIQRHAYETRGDGIWRNLNHEVPVTIEKTVLPDLPIESFVSMTYSNPSIEEEFKLAHISINEIEKYPSSKSKEMDDYLPQSPSSFTDHKE